MADGATDWTGAGNTVGCGGAGPRRVVVITGASSGIGRCTAVLFGRNGWDVGLVSRGAAGLEAVRAELAGAGARAAVAVADVADGAALEGAAAALDRVLGPADVWVNCAGNGVFGPFLDVPDDEFRRVTDVTYMGTVNGTRVALRRMVPRNRGVVVNVCSAVVFGSLPCLSSYSGAKHAVRGFTDSVRHELEEAGSRVRLVSVFPPAVNTPFFSHAVSHLPRPPRPAKPVYQPDVVADAVLLAATGRRHEIAVSGVTAAFALSSRLMPGLVRWAIGRLGSGGQMTDSAEAARLHVPTLAGPSAAASGAYGPFSAEARGFSMQVWALRHRGMVAGAAVAAAGALAVAAMR